MRNIDDSGAILYKQQQKMNYLQFLHDVSALTLHEMKLLSCLTVNVVSSRISGVAFT